MTVILGIVQSGEKLLNAYIYAIAEESADVDFELYNIERMSRPFDLFSPTLTFDHHNDVKHQNFMTRKSAAGVTIQPKQAP